MSKIKIVSNPYNREISYYIFDEDSNCWEDIREKNQLSRLREDESERAFLPFKIKEIMDIIIKEYHSRNESIDIVFEGTNDEYKELQDVCNTEYSNENISISKSSRYLENARFITKEAKETFEKVEPIISKIIRDDTSSMEDLHKVSDALKDIVPICVFGNYSSGKSTFINALIGSEVLPSGGDPVTAKIYKISNSTQPDYARIRFDYLNTTVDLSFESENYRFLKGATDSPLLEKVKSAIDACPTHNLVSHVNAALEKINGIDKKDNDSFKIGTVIELEFPFSKKGILGRSGNSYVIFDTPGSNSASNVDHSKVLAEALKGFSNGIPVWISTFESLDTNDNAELCDQVLEIKALDKRFTMIVLNKADGSDLPENGFSSNQIQKTLEYTAVDKMYSAGIFFVSSIMGLGAKNQGKLTDKFYRKTYRTNQAVYSDPEDMDYMSLYKYNIMPEQLKTRAILYSENCKDIIYANSGLFCIEMSMEIFASKYSAYNKCQMVYLFLNQVIGETNARIEQRTERLERARDARNRELEGAKKELIDKLKNQADLSEREYKKTSNTHIRDFLDKNNAYSLSIDEVNLYDEEIRLEYSEEENYTEQQNAHKQSWVHLMNSAITNGGNLFVDFFNGNEINLKEIKDELIQGVQDFQSTRKSRDEANKNIERKTSDRVIEFVNKKYHDNMMSAHAVVSEELRSYWQEKAQALRDQLVTVVAGSEALSTAQRDEISSIILNYEPLELKDDEDDIFIKKKYLRGNILGYNLGDTEKLDIKRLTYSYNRKINSNIYNMAYDINKDCFTCFQTWEQSLCALIESNITEYNPGLRDLADMIRDDTDRIIELAEHKKSISDALIAINEMMAWKDDSGDSVD